MLQSRRRSSVVFLFISFLFLTLTHSFPAEASGTEPVPSSLVKVFVQSNPVNLASPWQKEGVASSSGSGVIIKGNRILTAAHVVQDYVSVEVKREGMARKFLADVKFIGNDCDLAILTVENPAFFEGVTPVELGRTPGLQDAVSVYGYPMGGDAVSVTKGIVSRVEVSHYAQSYRKLLLAQIDAAINPGNSGGPVIADGSLVGIAIQSIDKGENLGYMVPAPVIKHFLEDIADQRFDGFPELGLYVDPVQNEALKGYLKMTGSQTGALVRCVFYGGSTYQVVQRGDVILAVGGNPVEEDLTIPFENGKRLDISYAVSSRQIGDSITLDLLRNGEQIRKEITLKKTPFLVPRPEHLRDPEYFVFGGIVFQPLTMEYTDLFEDLPADLAYYAYYHNIASEKQRQLIVINKILAAPLNQSYQNLADLIVESVNDITPRDMQHLEKIINTAVGPYLVIKAESGETIALDLERARKENRKIFDLHGVR